MASEDAPFAKTDGLAVVISVLSKALGGLGHHVKLAHLIEAGADMFLIPSRCEPCGLNQMYSMRYGTVPIVWAIGGLDDAVTQYDASDRSGTGFKFTEFESAAMLGSI